MIFSFKPVFTGQNDLLLLLLSADISIEMKFLTLELKKYVFEKKYLAIVKNDLLMIESNKILLIDVNSYVFSRFSDIILKKLILEKIL